MVVVVVSGRGNSSILCLGSLIRDCWLVGWLVAVNFPCIPMRCVNVFVFVLLFILMMDHVVIVIVVLLLLLFLNAFNVPLPPIQCVLVDAKHISIV